MKYGARNEIVATVKKIKKGEVMCQVDVGDILAGKMSSVMTMESIEEMGLKEGDKVKVVVKAVNVLLIKE
ncbi:TOBE domain-containing protein [Sulfurospirillum cavolei]|uniref:TOBE domain-containing protein n=1 Tax=Sulfurospirillum cavolei TaxID=366522 RepID=UPI0007648951|nr:TOBE domain-containing protein [Sulfurospirillum cavolei]